METIKASAVIKRPSASASAVINRPGLSAAATISGGEEKALYFKNGTTWAKASKVFKKVNGSWVQQSDLTSVFQTGVNYRKG